MLAIGVARDADAAPGWVDGRHKTSDSLCRGKTVTLADAWVSYIVDPAAPTSTGDVVYLRAVQWNVSECINDEARIFFTLPEGAILATSEQNRVHCLRGNNKGFVENVPPSEEQGASCLQNPIGTTDGLFFGKSPLPGLSGERWFLEIQVPVRFDRQLDGSKPAHGLRAKAIGFGSPSGTTTPGFLELEVRTPVAYRPFMTNHSSTALSGGFSADMRFDLYHFYEEGIVEIVHGTDEANMYNGSPTYKTSAAALGNTGNTIRVTTLTPGRRNYWRVKITTWWGQTSFGPVQTIDTPNATLTPRPPRCTFWGGC
ncbi:MAG: hypothetical protein ACKV2T_02815 [Kofleriaceae bacterium]